jgi:hypothetical protein
VVGEVDADRLGQVLVQLLYACCSGLGEICMGQTEEEMMRSEFHPEQKVNKDTKRKNTGIPQKES